MIINRNLGSSGRAFYILAGLGLALCPLFLALPRWAVVVLPVAGVVVIIEGLLGY